MDNDNKYKSVLCDNLQICMKHYTKSTSWYLTKMDDYTVVSNINIYEYIYALPLEIKPKLSQRWMYTLNVPYKPNSVISKQVLHSRILRGSILAYMYVKCSFGLNHCVYYGYLPAENVTISDTHKICRISGVKEWPRELYLELIFHSVCTNHDKCGRFLIGNRDGKSNIICINTIDWSNVSLTMGAIKVTNSLSSKEMRVCKACAQCIKCYSLNTFCRAHKKCTHKQRAEDEMNFCKLVTNIKLKRNNSIK